MNLVDRQALLRQLRRQVDTITRRPGGSTSPDSPVTTHLGRPTLSGLPTPVDPGGLLYRHDFAAGHLFGNSRLQKPDTEMLTLLRHLLRICTGAARDAYPPLQPEELLFFDLETTGLSRSTSTLPFLIGLGCWTGADFRVDQLFLRDPSQEPQVLEHLQAFMARARVLVSFNGRSFDAPLLKNRLILNRAPRVIDDKPHLDLLPLCRRLFRQRLEDCRLGTLERELLGFRRQGDLDGSEAPRVYSDWLRTGQPGDLPLLLEHNRLDVLLMAPLLDLVVRHATDPLHWAEDGEELLGSAQLHLGGDPALAEACLRRGLELARAPTTRRQLLAKLAHHLRRQGRRQEASRQWERFLEEFPQHDAGWIELAKYHEHVTGDLPHALELVEHCPRQHQDHHQRRLQRLRQRVRRVLERSRQRR